MPLRILKTIFSIAVITLLLSSCSSARPQPQDGAYPIYFAPESSFQILDPGVIGEFPFAPGDLLEIDGTLIYHGLPDWNADEVMADALWSASLYPRGRMASADTLLVAFRGITDPQMSYEFEWAVDNDTRLLLVSDRAVPTGLFAAPQIGDAVFVCLTLQVVDPGDKQDCQLPPPIILQPAGELVDSLIYSEIRKCGE